MHCSSYPAVLDCRILLTIFAYAFPFASSIPAMGKKKDDPASALGTIPPTGTIEVATVAVAVTTTKEVATKITEAATIITEVDITGTTEEDITTIEEVGAVLAEDAGNPFVVDVEAGTVVATMMIVWVAVDEVDAEDLEEEEVGMVVEAATSPTQPNLKNVI